MNITAIAPALGVVATVLFVISQAPMLIKAARTKDLASYSGTNLVIANLGNVMQTGYIVTLPMGPVWALHGFNMLASGCMLFWWLRYGRRAKALARPPALVLPTADALGVPAHHRSRTSSPLRARETQGKMLEAVR